MAGVLLMAISFVLSSCQNPNNGYELPGIVAANMADSVALRAYDGFGGPQMWADVPVLRFDFGFDREGQKTVARRHLWNRATGDYRVEWEQGDTSTVVLFNVGTREGEAYFNGTPAPAGLQEELVQRAHRGFANDTYWLLMPIKMFDDGVRRSYAADSSTDVEDVVHLSFGEVGYTPGDQYWVWVRKSDGRVTRWTYLLEGRDTPRTWMWDGYEEYDTEAGTVRLSNQKVAPDGSSTLYTDAIAFPATTAEMFEDPNSRL